MTYRRSTKLLLLPAVAIAMGVLIAVAGGGGAVIAILVGAYWVVAAIADYSKQLSIAPDRLEMHGYLGGPIVINHADARRCRYVRLRVHQRSVEIAFLEIVDAGGRRLKVWRYGWGRHSGQLFAALRD